MWRTRALVTLCIVATGGCLQARSQFKTELINDEGATAPCVGIGPIGGPAAKKCAELFEQSGFLKAEAVGVSGLTVGTSDKDDGVIIRVDPGSPASQAGLAVGDVLLAVDQKPVKPTPGAIAAQRMFGPKGQDLHLKIRRSGSEMDITLVRAPQAAPPNAPKSPSFFMSVKPLIDWRGQFVPCIGMGPAAMAAIAYCDSHFKPFGFIKVGERGATGIQVDPETAKVTSVDPGSPAAKADLRIGDEIVAVEGKPLTGCVGETATRRLFGKVGDELQITVRRGAADKTVPLKLAAKS